ncbi:putative C-type lectin domain family 20 member A isoform X1, partial [Clarias magur]
SYVGNTAYILVTSSVTWYDAQSYCRQHHTDLASARSLTEYQLILKPMTGVATHVWIGLFREPWKWSDQANLTINLWMLKKPDDALGNQNCGYISNGLAADAQCSDIMPFFCHKIVYPRRQWTIKVRVQSNQDVNDPMVKEAILEK